MVDRYKQYPNNFKEETKTEAEFPNQRAIVDPSDTDPLSFHCQEREPYAVPSSLGTKRPRAFARATWFNSLLGMGGPEDSQPGPDPLIPSFNKLEACIQDQEEGLECLFRQLIKTRVSLLNILNQ
ncbi:unnamed protein product [Prunus armeniaca]|uniref:Uncharacterized protein n=1 Tax=Prunus armeniaca TaxID=36596 RepID=A0A6J5Y5A1_PRUAR|nr:unnamed protein product [Prunus armeniaca]CAB4321286.1 unnamed protein product [Prunus armeniaca]